MAPKTIGDGIRMIEEGIRCITELTKHEPAGMSMDDEAGEGEPEEMIEKTIGRGRKKRTAPSFVKKEEDGGTDY